MDCGKNWRTLALSGDVEVIYAEMNVALGSKQVANETRPVRPRELCIS